MSYEMMEALEANMAEAIAAVNVANERYQTTDAAMVEMIGHFTGYCHVVEAQARQYEVGDGTYAQWKCSWCDQTWYDSDLTELAKQHRISWARLRSAMNVYAKAMAATAKNIRGVYA